ncbi:PREDICTED: ADP-ribosylation factor GTPase-activating protein AGD4-like [Ipomoea nil]|uniref:ADP-ribosylation factor GTPase-activating protein AGD4-like n=1 Tax=Ipomoea nil TaxID=35883 RepID=UPI0009010002|nr:PREDICTED: ADP-ribosylation factor GTPase-activating protein AGD4-like [Ipomoea nil]
MTACSISISRSETLKLNFPVALRHSRMAAFMKLEDSPMFHKQVRSLEHTTDELRDRCHKLYKGCKKYTDTLGEAHNGDNIFADSLEVFGGGHDDPLSVSIGGPIMSKFVSAFRELATYKELLRSQVEHVLVDRLTELLSVGLQDVKESRRRFDKATTAYDQAREKFASLKKSTRDDVITELEEDLHNSKSAFERSRFNLVNALMNVEARKKHEFLESFSAIMDAHLRYFKLGHDLLSQMEPFIHQVLTYAQQSKEQTKIEQDKLAKRIQEFRTQSELDRMKASSNISTSTSTFSSNGVGMSSYKNIEAIMLSSEVQTIKQGYLLKRSSSLRADWKRRFFVLDSLGNLYYYRHRGPRSGGSPPPPGAEHNSRVFSRFRARYHKSPSLGEDSLGFRTVDLRTSIIKVDAEDTDLRLCFRIISPSKTYTLQAENEADRIDWMNKITGVIASLLNSHLNQLDSIQSDVKISNDSYGACINDKSLENIDSSLPSMRVGQVDSVSSILREIPGNDKCAECGVSEPNWASLNLGILICIECSGIHRNLGVHISKVRSITLDVRVWEPTVVDLFQTLGNSYCNSVWEDRLLLPNNETTSTVSVSKPNPADAFHQKEKYILAKYVEKLFINKEAFAYNRNDVTSIWEAVKANDLKEVYRFIVVSDVNIVNATYDEVAGTTPYHHVTEHEPQIEFQDSEMRQYDPAACENIKLCLQGCSLLHLACQTDNPTIVELLLQFGADINKRDFHGRTALQHCISTGNNKLAKFLLRRGARASIKDAGGFSILERTMETGAIKDEELFVLLAESD